MLDAPELLEMPELLEAFEALERPELPGAPEAIEMPELLEVSDLFRLSGVIESQPASAARRSNIANSDVDKDLMFVFDMLRVTAMEEIVRPLCRTLALQHGIGRVLAKLSVSV